ncbi:MAG: VWA domain-containing protein [Pontiellaceae bacterium]|nr:VWA domain-containing protein [Pontiellaceae bacterium]MBN2784653.1 VWA domain-containing protein [Pontiellaceae bacterium]
MKKWMMLVSLFATMLGHADQEIAGVLFSPATTNEALVVLPLKKTEVHIDVTAGIARTEVIQRFTNPADRPLEAVYIFPLPSEAAVDGFELRLKDRVVRSTVREKEEAKAVYEQAKAEGRHTALLEQERPNLFTTSVANLMPGESVDICFSYVEALRFQKDRYDITFPTVVGERYIPFKYDENLQPETVVEDAARLNPPVLYPCLDSGHRLSIDVTLNGLPVRTVTSSTHAIQVHDEGHDCYRIMPGQDVIRPDCEFSLAVQLRANEAPAVTFVQSVGDEMYGLLSVFPPIGRERKHKALPKDVIFLIDTSGSMSGDSISQARAGLRKCLDILNPEDRFTVVRFADNYSGFSPDLRDASPDKLAGAREYIANLTADGGTEMQSALSYVLSLMGDTGSRMPLVVFLTDGDVGNEESLINLLSKELGNTRLFTFGIGSAPNEFLMHRMAEVGRGQSRFIRSHEDIGEVMADFFQTLDAPVLTDVELEWEGAEVNTYPMRCPDIFYGRPLQVAAYAPGGFEGRVKVIGQIDGEHQEYVIDLEHHATEQHDAIDTLYGRMQIKDLMVQLMQTDDEVVGNELKQAVIRIALKHQLVTRFTSRVAVEEQVVNRDGELISVRVPVEAPKGWQMYATATQEALQLVLGILILLAALLWRRSVRAA